MTRARICQKRAVSRANHDETVKVSASTTKRPRSESVNHPRKPERGGESAPASRGPRNEKAPGPGPEAFPVPPPRSVGCDDRARAELDLEAGTNVADGDLVARL